MADITYTAYREVLNRLPILDPSREVVETLFPYLDASILERVLGNILNSGKERITIAAPPIRVRGNVHMIEYGMVTESESGLPRKMLSYAYPHRIKDNEGRYPFANSANAYAEAHWPSELINDTWETVGVIVLDDPTQIDQRGYPQTVGQLWWGLSAELNDLINQHHAPTSVIIDDHLVILTNNSLEAREMKGGRGGYTDFNCANCGAALSLNHCRNCGFTFRDDNFRCGGFSPLTPKMVSYLTTHGHIFGMDPEIALKKEALKFQEYFGSKA